MSLVDAAGAPYLVHTKYRINGCFSFFFVFVVFLLLLLFCCFVIFVDMACVKSEWSAVIMILLYSSCAGRRVMLSAVSYWYCCCYCYSRLVILTLLR